MRSTEPVALAAAVTTAVRTVLAALVLLNVLSLSDEQVVGLVLAVEAVLNVPLTLWARARVTPATVDA